VSFQAQSIEQQATSLPPNPAETLIKIGAGGVPVLALLDEHDLFTAQQLGCDLFALLLDNEIVVVDLSSATFIDSAGLHALVKASRQARSLGHRLLVHTGANEHVKKILKITGLDGYLDHAPILAGQVGQSRARKASKHR
jgi:anti-anti-sigma factor